MTSESPVCNVVICELFCPKIVMQELGYLSTKTDATLNWNHLGSGRPCVVPHQKGWANSRSNTAPTNTTPELHGSMWGNISVPFSAGMSKWVKRRTILPWMNCQVGTTESSQTGSGQPGRAETNNQIAIVVSTGQRGAMCLLPSLGFSFRNTSLLWYSAHMYVQTPT